MTKDASDPQSAEMGGQPSSAVREMEKVSLKDTFLSRERGQRCRFNSHTGYTAQMCSGPQLRNKVMMKIQAAHPQLMMSLLITYIHNNNN